MPPNRLVKYVSSAGRISLASILVAMILFSVFNLKINFKLLFLIKKNKIINDQNAVFKNYILFNNSYWKLKC